MEWFKERFWYIVLLLLLVFITILWVIFPTLSHIYFEYVRSHEFYKLLSFFNQPDAFESMTSFAGSETKAAFGDSYGALNTLFSGLAFAGIIVSIFLQSKELRETRREMKSQGDQFDLQTQAMNTQIFESKFFQLMHLHGEKAKEVRYERSGEKGQLAFDQLYAAELGVWHSLTVKINDEHTVDQAVSGAGKYFQHFRGSFGAYFNNFYLILLFIDKSEVEDKAFYANLLKAQLSSYELVHIFFYGIGKSRKHKFGWLMERYKFFNTLHLDLVIRHEYLNFYEQVAYGANAEILHALHETQIMKNKKPAW